MFLFLGVLSDLEISGNACFKELETSSFIIKLQGMALSISRFICFKFRLVSMRPGYIWNELHRFSTSNFIYSEKSMCSKSSEL